MNISKILNNCLALTRDRNKKRFIIKSFHKTREVDIFYNNSLDELVTVAEGHNIVFETRNGDLESEPIEGDWVEKIEKEVEKYARFKSR